MQAGLEQARRLPDGLLEGIAGLRGESRVDPGDPAVQLCQHDGIGGGFEGGALQSQGLLGLFAGGNVACNQEDLVLGQFRDTAVEPVFRLVDRQRVFHIESFSCFQRFSDGRHDDL